MTITAVIVRLKSAKHLINRLLIDSKLRIVLLSLSLDKKETLELKRTYYLYLTESLLLSHILFFFFFLVHLKAISLFAVIGVVIGPFSLLVTR
ncbi:hypothetical protein BDF14DRAFT_1818175 [Spinellus fusiger]|nr:hypothetical protein BDF14DRAFT_1818175 [Spinellus fusiger]